MGATNVSFASTRGRLVWYHPIEEGARYVRKYLYLAIAAASAAVLAAPIVAEAAPAAGSHVLTIKKAHGAPVKPGAALKASLVKGTSAVFSLSGIIFSCKQSSFTAIVVKNPKAPGTATEAITAETMSKCSINIPMAKIKNVKALNLPYNSTVSDKKGFPVSVSGRKKSKPIELTSTASLNGQSLTCTYKAASILGSASNKGNTITIVKQKFTKASGPALCPASATFTAKYGPVVDTSLKGNPAVFVN